MKNVKSVVKKEKDIFIETGEVDRVVRIKLSAAVLDISVKEKSVLLSCFDNEGKLHPPSGWWYPENDLKTTALGILGNHVIFTVEGYCGFWIYKDERLSVGPVGLYADSCNLEILDHMSLEISDFEACGDSIFNIYFNNEYQGKAVIGENKNDLIEIIFLFKLDSLFSTNYILKDSVCLDRKVDWFTKEKFNGKNLTTRAERILQIL